MKKTLIDNSLITQEDLLDNLSNMIKSRIEDCESLDEVSFCIEDCVSEWTEIYNIRVTAE